MSNNYKYYDLNNENLPEGKGVLTGENYNIEIGKYIEENKDKINNIIDKGLSKNILESVRNNPNRANLFLVTSEKSKIERNEIQKDEIRFFTRVINGLRSDIDSKVFWNLENIINNKDLAVTLKHGF